MNSIQAIEERFGRDQISSGYIRVIVVRAENGKCIGFQLSDNGIGFNQQNLDSFVKMDSQKKASIGGKGVGRLLWLKVTDAVRIESVLADKETISRVSFEFCIQDPIRNIEYSNAAAAEHIGTIVDLYPYKGGIREVHSAQGEHNCESSTRTLHQLLCEQKSAQN